MKYGSATIRLDWSCKPNLTTLTWTPDSAISLGVKKKKNIFTVLIILVFVVIEIRYSFFQQPFAENSRNIASPLEWFDSIIDEKFYESLRKKKNNNLIVLWK